MLRRKTPLRSFTPLKAKRGLRRYSEKQRILDDGWHKLCRLLWEHRANSLCEICGVYLPEGYYQGHHIIRRARGRIDTADNALICCTNCHDHHKYKDGIKLTIERAQVLVRLKNQHIYTLIYALNPLWAGDINDNSQ